MLSIPLILLAVLSIAWGRLLIRRARRLTPPPRRQRLLGWTACLLGLLFMIVGVLSW
jgi:hypothetical protein